MRQVKMDLAVAAIIKAENIEVSDEDVEAEYKKMAEQFGMDVEMVKKYLAKEQVQDQLLTQKAVAVVVDSATAEKPKKDETAEGEKKAKKAPAKKAAKKDEAAEVVMLLKQLHEALLPPAACSDRLCGSFPVCRCHKTAQILYPHHAHIVLCKAMDCIIL